MNPSTAATIQNAKDLARQKADFTAEGAPPPQISIPAQVPSVAPGLAKTAAEAKLSASANSPSVPKRH